MLPFLTLPAVAPACHTPRHVIEQSQVFNGSQTLTSPAALGAGTFAAWVQRHALGAMTIVGGLAYDAADTLAGSTRKYRDLSGWSLVVANADGVWVDLELVAAGVASFGQVIGTGLKGALAQVVFLGGAAHVAPSAFGEWNIHGEVVPLAPSFDAATYGAKGFLLDFASPLSPGADASGLGHHLTPAGFDAAAADTVDSSPTNVYPTLDPLAAHNSPTITDGGLRVTFPTGVTAPVRIGRVIDVTDPDGWGWEVEVEAGPSYGYIGLKGVSEAISTDIAASPGANVGLGNATGQTYAGGGLVGTHAGVAVGDVVGVWVKAGSVYYAVNGVAAHGGAPVVTGLTGLWTPAVERGSTYGTPTYVVNTGQRPFAHGFPVGVRTLATADLPEPPVKDPAEGLASETATGANLMAVLDAATAHWGGADYVEIVKRLDVAEDWRLRFSDDPGQAWACNTANAKGPAPALAAAGVYVGHRLRVGAQYGVWTAEVEHVAGTATTVTHDLATARNAVIATRVSVGGGDRYYRHPDMAAGHLAKLNAMTAPAPDGTLTAFGADSCQIAATAPSGTYRVVVLAQRDGYLDLTKYAATAAAGMAGPFAPLTILAEMVLVKSASQSNAPVCLLDAARSPANPVSAIVFMDRPDIETAGVEIADFAVGGIKVLASRSWQQFNSAGDYCVIAIGRPVGGVCVAPATAR